MKGNILVYQTIPHRDKLQKANSLPLLKKNVSNAHDKYRASVSFNARPRRRKPPRTTLLHPHHNNSNTNHDTARENVVLNLGAPLNFVICESLWILRPLIYLLALFHFGKNSWIPLLLSLTTDITSHSFVAPEFLSKTTTTSSSILTELEKAELKRRVVLWLFYFLRSPLYEVLIYNGAKKVQPMLQRVGILHKILTLLGTYISDYKKYYFYISGS